MHKPCFDQLAKRVNEYWKLRIYELHGVDFDNISGQTRFDFPDCVYRVHEFENDQCSVGKRSSFGCTMGSDKCND